MNKLHLHFKTLFFILIYTTGTAQGMEPHKDNQLTPITFAQTYHYLSGHLLPDIMPLIFSFHLYTSGIDHANFVVLIEKSCKGPKLFVSSIYKLSNLSNYALVAEMFERYLYYKKVSICDIKSETCWTVLHSATFNGCPNTVKIILDIAGDKSWELLTIKSKGYTVLHNAASEGRIEIVKLLLEAAGDKSKELIAIQNKIGYTAFKIATPEAKEVMITYL